MNDLFNTLSSPFSKKAKIAQLEARNQELLAEMNDNDREIENLKKQTNEVKSTLVDPDPEYPIAWV